MKTACRLEVLGRVSCMSYCADTNACLVTTVINGSHIFQLSDQFYGPNLSSGLCSSSVESYPAHTLGEEAILSSCFLADGRLYALGSSAGTVTVVSRCSRAVTASYSAPDGLPIRSLAALQGHPCALLLCTSEGAHMVDMERATALCSLRNPAPRAVAAVPLSPSTYAVANYDGKVLLYDTRYSHEPSTVLSIPDQITSLAVCPESACVSVGTVAGRVVTLRCAENSVRERAFGTGKRRAPITSLSMYRNKIASGDLSGRLSLIDSSDVPDPTVHWTAETLLGTPTPSSRFDEGSHTVVRAPAWDKAEVTATTLSRGIAWVSFVPATSVTSPLTQVVALPA